MKKVLAISGYAAWLLVAVLSGSAAANLMTIGTATYGASDYNLIWDDDNNGNSVVWLDYTRGSTSWATQTAWAAGLNGAGVLSYNLYPGYSVDWGVNPWRLPNAGSNPQLGYDQTSSEMGHLYYDEFGLLSYPDRGNTLVTAAELNATNFDNLSVSYWFGTEYADFNQSSFAWNFSTAKGSQDYYWKDRFNNGLAVRSGQVSTNGAAEVPPVPEPSTFVLLGSGLISLAWIRRKGKSSAGIPTE